MKRHKHLIGLSHDHHHGLRLAQLIKSDAPEYKDLPNDVEGKVKYTIDAWENELNHHFENEEKILFPAVTNRDEEVDNLIDEIIIEHEQIEQLVNQLKAGKDKVDTLDDLGHMLEHHIRKEERELFDRIQKVFSEEELEKLVDKIEPVKGE